MFLPHSRQLTAMGKEGLYLEDHEEHLVAPPDGEKLSYSQAHYSPGLHSHPASGRRGGGQEEDLQDGSYQGRRGGKVVGTRKLGWSILPHPRPT